MLYICKMELHKTYFLLNKVRVENTFGDNTIFNNTHFKVVGSTESYYEVLFEDNYLPVLVSKNIMNKVKFLEAQSIISFKERERKLKTPITHVH